ncbi:MAG: hypothetical protein HKN43_10545 [Rhodothermales bacterium]|nr:hypothetical protein [Rhodothermales bacterium]
MKFKLPGLYSAGLLAVSLLLVSPSRAQDIDPRFGFGFNGLISTADGLGFGFRGRASAPVSPDLSFAIDLGTTGFFLGGFEGSTWVFDPQLSAIVTLDGITKAPYIIAGIGGYIPVADGSSGKGGPTLHGGFGYVKQLNETSLFYEVNPAIVIEKSEIELLIPFRIGVIF